jgi:hypothetical protein
MAGGTLTITVASYNQAPAVAQRLNCYVTAANKGKILTSTSVGGAIAFVIPEEIFNGALQLIRGGTNLIAGYVAGTKITVNIDNGQAIETNPNTCPSSAAQPTTSTPFFATNVGGNPLATTLTYANVAASGTVNILWGDGTSTLGAAESGASNHTYPNNGYYSVTIQDASVLTDLAVTAVHVP